MNNLEGGSSSRTGQPKPQRSGEEMIFATIIAQDFLIVRAEVDLLLRQMPYDEGGLSLEVAIQRVGVTNVISTAKYLTHSSRVGAFQVQFGEAKRFQFCCIAARKCFFIKSPKILRCGPKK